jgi:hypothetical protein
LQAYGAGLKDGQTWAPAESDTCIRTAVRKMPFAAALFSYSASVLCTV